MALLFVSLVSKRPVTSCTFQFYRAHQQTNQDRDSENYMGVRSKGIMACASNVLRAI